MTHRLLVPDEKLIISLVHSRKMVHRGDENIDLEDIVQTASGLCEDGLQVSQGLPLDGELVLEYFFPIGTWCCLTVLSLTVPSTSLEVLGSIPMLPEQYTMPLNLTACENWGSG